MDDSNLLTAIDIFIKERVKIEHNPQAAIKSDFIIGMESASGKNGGSMMLQGTVWEIFQCGKSKTGEYLKRHFCGYIKST